MTKENQIADKICEILQENGIDAGWMFIDMDDNTCGYITLYFELPEADNIE